MDDLLAQFRFFLKDTIRQRLDFSRSDQNLGKPPPPMEKPCAADARRIDLTPSAVCAETIPALSLTDAIGARRSRRRFSAAALSLTELSFLLWATQGVCRVAGPGASLRTAPSAGARHALETYLVVGAIDDLDAGLYRYLPLSHQLVLERAEEDLAPRLAAACLGQRFIGQAAVSFIWTAIPYRMEWRYLLAAHRVILLDAGHVGQNLYLACEAIGAGTCGIGAYDQQAVDRLIGVDGDDEFTIYLAPVGRPAPNGT